MYIPENKILEREKHIEMRWKQLHALAKESGQLAIQYLFTSNAGGVVAVLTYLGALAGNANTNELIAAKMTLICFTLGVIFVGLYRALIVHYHENMFYVFHEAVSCYYRDKDWENMRRIDSESVGKHRAPYALAYGALISFFIGCLIGGVAVLI